MTRTFQLGLIAAWACILVLLAQSAAVDRGLLTQRLSIPRVSSAPTLDDYLGGRHRSQELDISDFRQRDPYDGEPAISPTTVFVSYDETNLYAIFVCKDAAGKARAHIGRRDDLTGDETVSFMLDTFHDGRHAYEFISNPLGVQMDGMITEGQDEDFSFDADWRSEGRATTDGYVVWMAIPFKSLRFRRGSVSDWGIAFGRYIPTNNESDTWPHLSRREEAYVPQFAALGALTDIRTGRGLQLTPYIFGSRQRFLDSPDSPLLRSQNEFRAGLDAKYVYRDRLTFDFTLNPDFSQIESDEPQVTINQRYEVFFPERRPFFTESANYFEAPETLFFSRRVIDPKVGVRMTGKVSGWTLGFLSIDDRSASQVFGTPGEGRAHIEVARVQRDIGNGATVGGFFSQYNYGAVTNQVVSLDSRIKLDANWVFTAQGVHSSARDVDGIGTSGYSLLTEMAYVGRNFVSDTTFRDRSPGFRADLGFIPHADIRLVKNETRYRWRPEGGAVTSFGPSLFTSADWDHAGQLQDWTVDAPFTINLKRSTSVSAGHLEVFERFQNIPFRQNANYVNLSSEPWNWATIEASYSRGTNINYFSASGMLPFLANSTDATASLNLRPTARLRFSETYIFDRLHTTSAQSASAIPGAIFNNHLLRTRISYQFTRRLAVRAIVDYNAVLSNPLLVDLERTKRISKDFLFSYVVHPGTALYIGYSDQFDNLAFDAEGSHRVNSPGLLTGRQFFMKLSYQFRP